MKKTDFWNEFGKMVAEYERELEGLCNRSDQHQKAILLQHKKNVLADVYRTLKDEESIRLYKDKLKGAK